MMEDGVSLEQVRALLTMQGLHVPEDEIENIRIRLSTWFAALEEIEAALGEEMDETDPIPPVYPREEF